MNNCDLNTAKQTKKPNMHTWRTCRWAFFIRLGWRQKADWRRTPYCAAHLLDKPTCTRPCSWSRKRTCVIVKPSDCFCEIKIKSNEYNHCNSYLAIILHVRLTKWRLTVSARQILKYDTKPNSVQVWISNNNIGWPKLRNIIYKRLSRNCCTMHHLWDVT